MYIMGRSNSLRIFLLLSCSISLSIALSFNLASFESTKHIDVECNGDARISGAGLDLNREATRSAGRALYRKPMQLWVINDGNTVMVADFSTHFAFEVISSSSSNSSHGGGGGFSFVMVPYQDSTWSPTSYGGLLGLFGSNASALDLGDAGQNHPLVAVEFDEGLDPDWDFSSDHVGIDVNSLKSKRYVNLTASGFINKGTANVWLDYNSTSKNLSVSFAFSGNLGSVGVFHILDLRDALPQRVQVGFTASTGSSSSSSVVTHRITSWSFSSPDLTMIPIRKNMHIGKKWLSLGLPCFVVVVVVGVFAIIWWFIFRKKYRDNHLGNRCRRSNPILGECFRDFGVKKVPYEAIRNGTKDFNPKYRLGKGGSGSVYSCKVKNPKRVVAAKIINTGSNLQGVKEFMAELSIVSQISHPNVVHLVCWSHSNNELELCLCYELMQNKSLNWCLHRSEGLDWDTRFLVSLQVAQGLAHLHWEFASQGSQVVIHRDIKSDNVLLDKDYNAKVADFGVARFVESNHSMKTTEQYGTRGYVAPEVAMDNMKASRESDVYSFGILLLELITGIDPRVQYLPSFVHGKKDGEVIDKRLKQFNSSQAKVLLELALMCCKRAPATRPRMTDVKDVLESDDPLSKLPLTPHQHLDSLDEHPSSFTDEYLLPPTDVAPLPDASTSASASAPAPAYGPAFAPA